MAEARPGVWDRVASRTRNLFQEGLRALASPLDPAFYAGLEELLLAGDVGPSLAARLTDSVRRRKPLTLEEARAALEAEVVAALSAKPRSLELAANPSVVLLYGVNGAGKTTTVAKLASGLKQAGRRPLVVAADTFRAAGIEQMVAWAERAGVEAFAGKPGGDAAAVAFDAIQAARGRGFDTVLVDTAGRLQTQHNLMEELRKVARVVGRALEGAPQESLLVLDATLGQNSLAQARAFNTALGLTGLVLAKMDGTARGGSVIAIESELEVPTKLIGLGEKLEDLYAFDPAWFARALFG
ncbi:MAG: signal recognition particle-docking protein FtsY [Chloroflexi bacterium]|nr:MAG: signal recognition particle-docking protein FtsY [Chloroflexota bacterium]TME15666.1 MAG: signal recognition particle-docking protein FtsY [Chloroflexota bacterium]